MREVIAKLPSFFREVKIVNKVILMGRLTKDPDVRYTQGEKPMAVARYTVAVNRVYNVMVSRRPILLLRGFWPYSRICREIFPAGY